MPKEFFPRVKEAREALRGKALELFENYMQVIKDAAANGEYETALENMRWLIEHMPKGDEGERMIDESAAKPKVVEKQTGPQIQIGIALGQPKAKKALPPSVIDVTNDQDDTN